MCVLGIDETKTLFPSLFSMFFKNLFNFPIRLNFHVLKLVMSQAPAPVPWHQPVVSVAPAPAGAKRGTGANAENRFPPKILHGIS